MTSNIAGHVYSSEEMIHSLQDPHIKAFDDLEVEATKLEDLHHVSTICSLLDLLDESFVLNKLTGVVLNRPC